MSDRKALIRLASTLPKGSEERKAILTGLQKQGADMETVFRQRYEQDGREAHQALTHLVKAHRILKDLPVDTHLLERALKVLKQRLQEKYSVKVGTPHVRS